MNIEILIIYVNLVYLLVKLANLLPFVILVWIPSFSIMPFLYVVPVPILVETVLIPLIIVILV